jgi:hypothetical protein
LLNAGSEFSMAEGVVMAPSTTSYDCWIRQTRILDRSEALGFTIWAYAWPRVVLWSWKMRCIPVDLFINLEYYRTTVLGRAFKGSWTLSCSKNVALLGGNRGIGSKLALTVS